MRHINDDFINDLLHGELAVFHRAVVENRDKLALEIRDGYISIYYKGGNLLKITYHRKKGYEFAFDPRYCLNKPDCSAYDEIKALDSYSAAAYAEYLPCLLHEMDTWFEAHPKAERDFQHRLLVNNAEIIDIEYQVGNKMRLDMLAFHGRKLVLIENKYGLGAVTGSAGLSKHYADMCQVWETPSLREELLDSVVQITAAKKALGLMDFAINKATIQEAEILFLLAGYNPKSRTAANEAALMKQTVPAKLLYMAPDESRIRWDDAENCF